MKHVYLVEITQAESGWKGNWYKVGQRHFVTAHQDWPDAIGSKFYSVDIAGGIDENDCRVLSSPLAWLRCRAKEVKRAFAS